MNRAIIERPSPNFNERRGGAAPDMVILHYTGMQSAGSAIAHLCDPASKVSSHYVIDQAGQILRLLDEAHRAWHAGVSHWQGERDINSRSIGIELVNRGHSHGYSDYPELQMLALIALLRDIRARQPMQPEFVLGHSDVAPTRKQDPGEKFDWKRLHAEGFGLWVPPEPLGDDAGLGPGDQGAKVKRLQRDLLRLGFGAGVTGAYDPLTVDCVTAFQRHWRPARIDGRADGSTMETLSALL